MTFYWCVLYISLYVEVNWELSHGATKWLNAKIKATNTQNVMFFIQDLFLVTCFFVYICCAKLMVANESYCVPHLQVIAQLSCFLFLFKKVTKPVKQRLVWSFFLSLISSLVLLGKDWAILSLVVLLYSLFTFLLPLNFTFFVIFSLYFIDAGLAQWGFSLAFQQVCYSGLQFVFEKTPPKNGLYIVYWIGLLLLQGLWGYLYYKQVYLMAPQKLAALLSGACIVFLSIKNRTQFVIRINFIIYFSLSLFIGIFTSPCDAIRICGIQTSIFIFILMHLWPLLGLVVFRDSLPKNLQPLIPFFFSAIFFVLVHFPELAWLKKWIEGMDLLLLLLGVFSFVEKRPLKRERLKRRGVTTAAIKMLFWERKNRCAGGP